VAQTELVIGDLPPQRREVQATEGEIVELAARIKAVGLKHPITVIDGVIADGLLRVEAYKHLKLKTIPAVVSDDFVELCLALEASREPTETLPTGRVLEIMELLEPARARFHHRRRRIRGVTKKKVEGDTAGIPIRKLLGRAVGLSESRVELLKRARQMAEVDDAAKVKLEELRAGTESMYGWNKWVQRRTLAELAPVASADEVRTVMERGLRTIGTALEAMSKFGTATVLTRAEREQVLKELITMRTRLLRLHREIRGGLKDEVEEGKV